MAIQLSGAQPRDYTFNSAGTRADLVAQFHTQLVAAGWSSISSTVLESATTPQGLKVRIEALDPGTGNCAQFKIRDNGALVGPTTIFLLPVGGAQFRIWANPYQFFYFLSGTDMSKQRALVCGGVPWIPEFLESSMSAPYAGWLHGNGTTDTGVVTLNNSLRKNMTCNNLVGYSAIWNGAVFGATTSGEFGLLIQTALTSLDDMWEDGTYTIFEPVVCWRSISSANPVRHGLLWDCVLGSHPLDSEVRRTFANITWRNITHQSNQRFSILLVVVV